MASGLTAFDVARHFYTLMGSNPSHKALAYGWCDAVEELLTNLNTTSEQLMEFMTWAAIENTDPKPQFNSVEYLAKSKDPMAILVKHSASLYRVWQGRKRSAAVVVEKKAAEVKPLPVDQTTWLMLGPGVNEPLHGFTSCREKLNAIKWMWYGRDFASYPDPVGEWEEMFKQYRRDFDIAKTERDKRKKERKW
jgi:hypothetical protein